MNPIEIAALTAALIAVDGDTVKIPETDERLRLEMIDAPERGHRADCASEAALAERATRRMFELLPDVVAIEGGTRRGGWGRRLVVLSLADGQTAGDVLISEGLAVPWAGHRHEWCVIVARPEMPPFWSRENTFVIQCFDLALKL